MLDLEHLHADALLVVLIGAAAAILALRAAVYVCHRALIRRDRELIAALNRSRDRG